MIKTISLRKLVTMPKLKMQKQDRVYDKEWKMYFQSEEERKEFRERIERAEKNIEEGKYMTQKEVNRFFSKKYGF